MSVFVDDTIIYLTGCNINDAIDIINNELNIIHFIVWLSDNNMCLNNIRQSKNIGSKYTLNKRDTYNESISDIILERIRFFKYLGRYLRLVLKCNIYAYRINVRCFGNQGCKPTNSK